MIGIVATMKVQPGKGEDFEAICKDLMAKVKANEPGCLTYQLYKPKGSEDTYVFLEQYASMDDVSTHGQTDYFKAAFAQMGACLAGRPDIQMLDIVE